MRPLVNSGSMAIVIVEDDKLPKAGDVILFKKNGKKFLHRILSLRRDGFITADDAGLTTPVFVNFDSVIGRCAVKPSGVAGVIYGYLSRFLFKTGRFIKKLLLYVNNR